MSLTRAAVLPSLFHNSSPLLGLVAEKKRVPFTSTSPEGDEPPTGLMSWTMAAEGRQRSSRGSRDNLRLAGRWGEAGRGGRPARTRVRRRCRERNAGSSHIAHL